MQLMAENFPGVFSGYDLQVVESHQRNKADTSGTAKAVVQSFNAMGLDFKEVRYLQCYRLQCICLYWVVCCLQHLKPVVQKQC